MASHTAKPARSPGAPSTEVEFFQPDIALVRLRGEHDISTHLQLADALATASKRLHVIVDLSDCTFMASSVIATLIHARAALEARNGRLALIIPPHAKDTQRLAALTDLYSKVRIYATQSAAIAGLPTSEHVIRIRDLRERFGDVEQRAAECSCGWRGEAHTGEATLRMAHADGRRHIADVRTGRSQSRTG